MYFDIYPQSAGSSNWATPSNALSDTGSGACATYGGDYNNTTSPAPLYLYNFNTSSLPSDITVTGIEIHVKGFFNLGSGAGTTIVGFGVDSSFTRVSASNNFNFTNADTWYVLGSSSPVLEEWSYNLSYSQLTNPYFSVNICAVNLLYPPSGGVYNIDACFVRVYYTESGFLSGTRSKFSYSNPILDNVSTVNNGIGLGYQVESDELNLIGDCLYNLEQAVITRTTQPILGVTGSLSHPHQYFYTIMISGTVNSWVSNVVYEKG